MNQRASKRALRCGDRVIARRLELMGSWTSNNQQLRRADGSRLGTDQRISSAVIRGLPVIIALFAVSCSRLDPEEKALTAYIQDVESAARGEVCSDRLPDFARHFEPTIAAWRAKNASEIALGNEIATRRGMNNAKPPNVRSFANINAAILEMIPEDDLRRRCGELLEDLQ